MNLAEALPNLQPVRLRPGEDLRRALEAVCASAGMSAFVVSGIGSLVQASLRLAEAADEVRVQGPLELLTLAGTLTPDGAHLHMSVADRDGRVTGGHVGHGNEIRTTAEVLLVFLPTWQLSREVDAATGYKELVIRAQE
jgi:predicted DNA-binding protein with PD1-like motif